MIICDTNVIIEYLKGNELTKNVLHSIVSKDIAISAITMMELMVGSLKQTGIEKDKKSNE